MRIIALLLLFVSVAAYRGGIKNTPQTPDLAATPNGQAANIFFQSADGGKTWEDLSRGLPENLRVNCVFSQDGEVFLGTEYGLYHSRNLEAGVWEQEEFGEMYVNDFGQLLLNERVTGVFAGRSGPYVCVAGSGFFRKIPGTKNWQPMHERLKDKSVYAVVENPDGTLFVGNNSGIFKSGDEGKTWKQVFSGGWVTSLTAADGVLVGSGSHGLLRSTDGGEHWDCVLTDESAIYKTSVMEGRFAAVRVAGVRRTCNSTAPCALRTSADGGETWQNIDGGVLSAETVYDFKQVGEQFFCSHKAGISRSADGGKTWELVRPAAETKEPLHLKLTVSGEKVFAVMVWEGC